MKVKPQYKPAGSGPAPVPSRSKAVALAALALALAAPAVEAQTFTYTTRDLIATFRRSGSSDLEVNLGSVNSLKSLAPGTTVNFSDRFDASSQLIGTFGDLNSLSFSVFGTQRGTGADPANTSWLTKARLDPATQTTAPGRFTASKSQNIQSAISGIAGDGASSGALVYSPSAAYPPSSGTALVIPTTGTAAANSYTTKYTAAGGLAQLVGSPGIENTTSASFSTTPGSVVVSDLYEYLPGSAGTAASYLGSFTFNDAGALTFQSVQAVPEPSALAMIALGFGLFGVFHIRRSNGGTLRPQTGKQS